MMPPSPSKPNDSAPGTARLAAEQAGRRAEAIAALFLRLKGYSIRQTRFRTPVGEIDLIASRWGTLVFVEVKARAGAGAEAEALTAVNKTRIARAAAYFLMRHPGLAQRPMRFDVIFLAPRAWPRHLKGAFDASFMSMP